MAMDMWQGDRKSNIIFKVKPWFAAVHILLETLHQENRVNMKNVKAKWSMSSAKWLVSNQIKSQIKSKKTKKTNEK